MHSLKFCVMETITYLGRITLPSSVSRVFSVKVRIRYINQQKSFTLYTVCYEKDIHNVVVKAR